MERTDSPNSDSDKSHIFKHSYKDKYKIPEIPTPLPWPSLFKLGHDGVYITEVTEDNEGKEKPLSTSRIYDTRNPQP
ncbi:MAG: hypothetical protein DELT_02222 [Desulfovibrio sp.]